jgi:hypothetical protein
MAVFFEQYIRYGSDRTREDFGPKDPVELKSMEKDKP